MSATYQKLRSGEWGVRVVGAKPREGDQVTVKKKDGTTKVETIAKVVFTGEHNVHICAVTQNNSSGRRTPSRRQSGDVRCRHCGSFTPEGDDWCMACGKADYEN